MTQSSWESYVNKNGDFNLALYLFKTINFLMKSSLDFGTMLSSDHAQLRAYKEQTKSLFKTKWLEVAQALEHFDIIVPCGCPVNDYCSECGGARYQLNTVLLADQLREIAVITADNDPKLATKLQRGLEKAMEEVGALRHQTERFE